MSSAKGRQEPGGRRLPRIPPAWDDDRVRPFENPKTPTRTKLNRTGRAERATIHRADLECIQRRTQLRPGQPEHLGGDGQLEQSNTVVGDRDDAVERRAASTSHAWEGPGSHGGILANNVISAYRGMREAPS